MVLRLLSFARAGGGQGLVINGHGFKLNGMGSRRVMYVNGTGSATTMVEFHDLTFTGGFVAASGYR